MARTLLILKSTLLALCLIAPSAFAQAQDPVYIQLILDASGSMWNKLEDGRYRWVLQVEPYVDPARLPDEPVDPFGPRLMHLVLQVQWGEGGPRERLRLETLRLVQPDAAWGSG